jgi:hypothetical protein
VRLLGVIDSRLLAVSWPARTIIILATLISMAVTVLPRVPSYGTDTIADMYEARVVLNDLGDMYTKDKVPQTPLEAATWSKEASSPYPPATLLALAALYASGEALGIGLYGMVVGLAVLFLGLSLVYFLRTRWYLFPLLYLNFTWLGDRLFYVQDGSYLVMLTMVMAALFAARRAPAVSHVLMAVAIVMKLSPLYYARHLGKMSQPVRVVFTGILVAGLVAPYLIWDNYLSIFRYANAAKGSTSTTAGALAIAGAFTALLRFAERRRGFDVEDLIGWSLVPMALFLAFKMNVARHLLLVLLVPDKRGLRNVAVAVPLALHALFPSTVLLNSTLPMATAILAAGLLWGRASGTPAATVGTGLHS